MIIIIIATHMIIIIHHQELVHVLDIVLSCMGGCIYSIKERIPHLRIFSPIEEDLVTPNPYYRGGSGYP